MMSQEESARTEPFAQALQETTLRCERLMQVLSILRQMDEVDEPSLGFDEICRRIVEITAFALAAENCSLYLVDDQGESLGLGAACSPFEDHGRSYSPGSWDGARFRLGEGIVGTAAKTRQSIRVDDAARDHDFLSLPAGRVRVRSLLAFPLVAGGRLVGVLNLSHSQPNFFSAESENALSFVAQRVARIFSSHDLYQRLRDSEEHYRLLAQNAGDGILVFDRQGRIGSANPAIEAISGIPAERFVSGDATWEQGIHSNDRARVAANQEQLLSQGSSVTIAYRYQDARGGERHLEQRSSPFRDMAGRIAGIVSVIRDVTERMRAEEERRALETRFQHMQKLESLGILAGGIAHDFNNLLVGILGNADLALTRLPPDSPTKPYLERIKSTAQRAADLTREMLAYSGKGAFIVAPVNLGALAQEMGHLLEAAIPKNVALQYDCARDLPLIIGDAAQLEQVAMNLITNAADAIGEKQGVVNVSIKAVRLDGPRLSGTHVSGHLPEGDYVCLEVSDTGSGIDANAMPRIFEPFFTTKFAGRGLGLAAVLGIVRGHGGAIEAHSEQARGTTFEVFFPVLSKEDAAMPEAAPKSGPVPPDMWRGGGIVLVADDEPDVRDIVEFALGDSGFTVLTAANGREAVDIFKTRGADIRAVILDLTMPVMGGREAFDKIREIRPDVPVILSSGYTERDAVGRFCPTGPSAFIQKPFVPAELIERLYGVLGP